MQESGIDGKNIPLMTGKLNYLNNEMACRREPGMLSKFQSKNEAKLLNQPKSRQGTTTSKNTKLTPKKKCASNVTEKKTELIKKCYNRAESTKPSCRHTKLIGGEIALETKQEESTAMNKTIDVTENNAVEEMKETENISVLDNGNHSFRGRKSQQLEVRDKIPESNRYIQVLSSSGISASHRTAPNKVIYRQVFSETPSEELSSSYKEELPLKDYDGMIAESSKSLNPIQSVTDSLSQIFVSNQSSKERKGNKRKAWSLFTDDESLGKNTKRYSDSIHLSSLGETSCLKPAQILGCSECRNNTFVSLNKLGDTQRGNSCEKNFETSSTNNPSGAETVVRYILRTGSFDDSLCYPYPETSDNPSSTFCLQEVTEDKAELYENYVNDMHMNSENRDEAGNIPKNGLMMSSHSGNSNQEKSDKAIDVKQTYLPQSKRESSFQMSEHNFCKCLNISSAKCSSICASKSYNYGKDYYCKNLQGIDGHPRKEKFDDDVDFTIGNITLDNLDKSEENLSKNSVCINKKHVYCTKSKIVNGITVELDRVALRKNEITLESCEKECYDRVEIQSSDYVSDTNFHTTANENLVLPSYEDLTKAVATRSCRSPLKTSSPNNTFDSDDEDVLSLYASSWAELDTEIETENDKNNKQVNSDQHDGTNESTGKEKDQMKNSGTNLKLHAGKSDCEQEITTTISDENFVACDMSDEEHTERNLEINVGKSHYNESCDEDILTSFHSRKYLEKDLFSPNTSIETETPSKLDIDGPNRGTSISEKSGDGVLLLGNSTGKCVQNNISDKKGSGVKVDSYRIALFSGEKKKPENFLSVINSVQDLILTENVESLRKKKKIKSGKDMKGKSMFVDEKIYSKRGSKLLEKAFLLPDLEPQKLSPRSQKRRKKNKPVPQPKFPVTSQYQYCLNFIHQGVCQQPACRYHHEMSVQLENYMSLLILHYVTHQQEYEAWRLIDSHTANSRHAPMFTVSLLVPLARYIMELEKHHEVFNVQIPLYLTSPLDVAKVRILCETHRGYDAYKLLLSCILNVTPQYLEVLIGTFVRYCESHLETLATSPWEKVLLWKYEKPETLSDERMKDILDIGWLKVLMEYKNVGRVCDAYSHLSSAISIPSKIFTYFTCSVINFFIEIGERRTSFWVLKEVQRLKANDADIFIALVPTDKESAMSVLPELVELGQLICELYVPLPTCTWELLSTLMMTYGNVTLSIDLLVCAMKMNCFAPEVNVLEKLLLECSRGDPALLWPTLNLVCAMSAESLTKLKPSLQLLVNQLACGPLHAQQVKYSIIRHCQAHDINLLSQTDCITHDMYGIRGNQVLSQSEVHDKQTLLAGCEGFIERCVNQIVELSEERNDGFQCAPCLKERYQRVDNEKSLLDLRHTLGRESYFQTKELSGYPKEHIRKNTNLSVSSNSLHILMENSNARTPSFTYPNKDSRENIILAKFYCQDQHMSSSPFDYQDHVLSLQRHSRQDETTSLLGSGSYNENHHRSSAASYVHNESSLPVDLDWHYKLYSEETPPVKYDYQYRHNAVSASCSAELGYQKRYDSGDHCIYYWENRRDYKQSDEKGECFESRQECTIPYDPQSSIYSKTPFQTECSESILKSSKTCKGLPIHGSLVNDVTSHLSISPESMVNVSGYHDDTYQKGIGPVFNHNSTPNFLHKTRNDLKLLKHTHFEMSSSHNMAQEGALYSSTSKTRLNDMNYMSGFSNDICRHRKKHIPFYSVKQKQQSCQPYHPPHELICTEAKMDHMDEMKQTKAHSVNQKRVNLTRGLKMIKTTRMDKFQPKMHKPLNIKKGKLSHLTEDMNHSCCLPEITQGCVVQKRSQNIAKITQSAIPPVWESASSSSFEYSMNPEVTHPVSAVSQKKRKTRYHQQNLRNYNQRKVRKPGIGDNNIHGQSGSHNNFELKLRNKTQEQTSRVTAIDTAWANLSKQVKAAVGWKEKKTAKVRE